MFGKKDTVFVSRFRTRKPFSLGNNSHVSSPFTFTTAEANLNNRLVIKGTMLLGYYCLRSLLFVYYLVPLLIDKMKL